MKCEVTVLRDNQVKISLCDEHSQFVFRASLEHAREVAGQIQMGAALAQAYDEMSKQERFEQIRKQMENLADDICNQVLEASDEEILEDELTAVDLVDGHHIMGRRGGSGAARDE